MKAMNLNIAITIFAIGTLLFLMAPLKMFSSLNNDQIFMASLIIQLIGVSVGVAILIRHKITEKLMKEI